MTPSHPKPTRLFTLRALGWRSILVAALLALAGCDPTNKPTMNPGQDCMSCHCTGADSCTASGLPWTAAGTIYSSYSAVDVGGVQGVKVMITDALQNQITLTTNEAGNFYTAEALQPPLTVTISNQGQTTSMITQPEPDFIYGAGVTGKGVGCNGCHQAQGPNGLSPTPADPSYQPAGRIVVPQNE